jgi:hypothetical protein
MQKHLPNADIDIGICILRASKAPSILLANWMSYSSYLCTADFELIDVDAPADCTESMRRIPTSLGSQRQMQQYEAYALL